MTWIPEEQRDTRWYIWHQRFQVRVPFIQTLSVEYIQKFGMPTTGDSQHDRSTANESVIRMLTIAEMVEYFSRGVTIAVCNVKDTKKIYEHITDHLMAWKKELEESIHVRNAPLEDLKRLDKLAHAVYAHAKPQFTSEVVESIINRRIAGASRVPLSRLLAMPDEIKPKELPPEAMPDPGRVSMADIFAARQQATRSRWS